MGGGGERAGGVSRVKVRGGDEGKGLLRWTPNIVRN